MKESNNWCCEIIKKTVSLFKPGDNFWDKNYCDINQRYFLLYFYWKKLELAKKVCDNCQKLWQAEKDKLKKEDEKWEKESEEELKNRNCANCQKKITTWRQAYKNFSEESSWDEDSDSDWKNKGVLGRWACKKHDDYYCQDDNCTDRQRAFCSLKCLEESENKEDKRYWLKKSTVEELELELSNKNLIAKKNIEVRKCNACGAVVSPSLKHKYVCQKCYDRDMAIYEKDKKEGKINSPVIFCQQCKSQFKPKKGGVPWGELNDNHHKAMELHDGVPYQINLLYLAEWECRCEKSPIITVGMNYQNWAENFIEENEKKINNYEDEK